MATRGWEHVQPTGIAKSAPRLNKYHARRVTVDGVTFDSLREAAHYQTLRILERAGEITALTPHPTYALVVNQIAVGRYSPDFEFRDRAGRLHIHEVKSKPTRTEAYRLRKRLFEALYHVQVEEVF